MSPITVHIRFQGLLPLKLGTGVPGLLLAILVVAVLPDPYIQSLLRLLEARFSLELADFLGLEMILLLAWDSAGDLHTATVNTSLAFFISFKFYC